METAVAQARALVVDDEALIRWTIVEQLSSHGYAATEAEDAASALRALSETQPDVIFLDYRLPDSKDLGLLRKIRTIAPSAAVIMMTAFGTPEMFTEAVELGAYQVLNKPFDVSQIPTLAAEARNARRR
jgi:DNA-binding NtrC family response regulator